MQAGVIIIVAVVVLIVGTVIAVVWWRLADRLFPGASDRTGQHIRLSKGSQPPRHAGAEVIKDFDDPHAKRSPPPGGPG